MGAKLSIDLILNKSISKFISQNEFLILKLSFFCISIYMVILSEFSKKDLEPVDMQLSNCRFCF